MLGILLAAIAGMALGGLWYSPLMFGTAWMNAIGKTHDELEPPLWPMVGSMIACVITAVALTLIFAATGADTVAKAAGLGLILGIGLVFTAMWSDSLFCGWGRKLLFIQSGYRIAYILLMSVILVLV